MSHEFVEAPFMQATVAYYLMLDNCRRLSNGYLGSEFEEAKVSVGQWRIVLINCSHFVKYLNSLFFCTLELSSLANNFFNRVYISLFLCFHQLLGQYRLLMFIGLMQEQLVSISPMSPMDTYGGTPRSAFHRTLTRIPSMERRGPSSSVLQHRVVAERKWVLGVQVLLYHFYVDGYLFQGVIRL